MPDEVVANLFRREVADAMDLQAVEQPLPVDRVEQVGLDGRGGGDVPDDDTRLFIMVGGRAIPIGAEQRDGGVDDLLLVVGRHRQVDRPVDAPGGQVVLSLIIRCESEESFYVAFTTFGKSFDCLMNQNPLVTADR